MDYNYDFDEQRERILDELDDTNGWADDHLRPIEMNGTDNKIIAVFKRDDDFISVSTMYSRREWFAVASWDDDHKNYQSDPINTMIWICKKMYLRDDNIKYDELVDKLNTFWTGEIIEWVNCKDCIFIGGLIAEDDDNLHIVKHNLYTYEKIDEINIFDKNNVEKILEEYK